MKRVLVTLFLGLTACGEVDINLGKNDGGQGVGRLPDASVAGLCSEENCDGCCDSNQVCQAGTSTNACGRGAGACLQCGVGLVCQIGSGRCSAPMNQADAGGCVDVYDCPTRAGYERSCTSNVCSYSVQDEGSTVVLCSSTNCDGCCDASGLCQKGQSNSQCGAAGASCVGCTSSQTCNALGASGGQCKANTQPPDAGIRCSTGSGNNCPVSAGYISACSAGLCSYTPGLRLFITRSTYTGNLGGIAGADAKCQLAAAAQNLVGTWRAFVSTATENAVTRMTADGPWYQRNSLGNFAKTFNNRLNLKTTPAFSISFDETGAYWQDRTPSGSAYFWTGTESGGVTSSRTCNNFTSDSGDGASGTSDSTLSSWVTGGAASSCAWSIHLLCLEQ